MIMMIIANQRKDKFLATVTKHMMMYDSIFYLLFASKIFFSLSLKVFKLIDVKSFTLH